MDLFEKQKKLADKLDELIAVLDPLTKDERRSVLISLMLVWTEWSHDKHEREPAIRAFAKRMIYCWHEAVAMKHYLGKDD